MPDKPVIDQAHVVDATQTVEVYQNGKTMECNCGQGFGVTMDTGLVRCPTCQAQVIDTEWRDREYEEQTSLSQFV